MEKQLLIGKNIKLRALEPEDLSFLFEIENNEIFWEVSHTQAPFSKFLLKQYLENAHLDIYEAKQLRLVIADKNTDEPFGLIDLFDFNPKHKRAGIGILVHPNFQKKGFASTALSILINYAFFYLDLHQLYANITEGNEKSISLFEKFNFKKVGIKKDWLFTNNSYQNEILYQLIKD
jgi:diamine N-acetyltransferase